MPTRRKLKPCFIGGGKVVHAKDPQRLFDPVTLCKPRNVASCASAPWGTAINCKRCLKAIARLETD